MNLRHLLWIYGTLLLLTGLVRTIASFFPPVDTHGDTLVVLAVGLICFAEAERLGGKR